MIRKVLITGGAGFIGSHLGEKLVALGGYDVCSLDNYFTGRRENHVDGVRYIKGDTNNISELIDFKPDIVFHLGEYSRVEQSFFDIEKIFQFNKSGTFKVLEFCRENNAKLIYAGSSTKFGDGGLGKSQSPYGWAKSSNTDLVVNYGTWFDLNYAITYFYNAFGPREIRQGPYASLVGIFSEKMKNGEPLTIVSPGTQRRNFTHVYDIVAALIKIGEVGNGDGFGIGSPVSYSIVEVAELFGGEKAWLPERRGNRLIAEVKVENTLKLGWKPKYDFRTYVEDLRRANWVI